MFKKVRVVATCIYIACMIATLIVAFTIDEHQSGIVILIIVLICAQFCALVWYAASYIPFARKAITGCCKSMVGM